VNGLVLLLAVAAHAAAPDIVTLVDKANKALRGDSSHGTLTMSIETPEWKRSVDVEGWNKDRTYAFIVIRNPPKDRGNTTLRRKTEMWVWIPHVERVIKVPPTMMHNAWQGSDFTYEDIVKADSIVKDYTHKLAKTVEEAERTVYTIDSTPKPDAPVVWGRVVSTLAVYKDDDGVVPLSELDYSERGELIRTITLSDVQRMSGRRIPLRLECVPSRKKGQRTVLQYHQLDFDVPLDDAYFSYARLQKGGG
jgi:hypothetical protein